MACYNVEQFIEESLSCILNQTLQDFELIVVDDGSVDGTRFIFNEYSKRDRRIKVLAKKHTGLTDSLQYGLKAAKGDWIARWDADDLADPKRLEYQFKHVQERPDIVLMGSGCIEIETKGKVLQKHIYPEDHHTLVRHLERFQKFFPHSSALYNRRKALSIGGYHTRFIYAQDRDLWLRLAEIGEITCLPMPLVYLRRHANTTSIKHQPLQILLSMAATVCHLRRIQGLSDPSYMDESVWKEFLRWLERRLAQEFIFSDEAMWRRTRASYYGSRNVVGRIRALMEMVKQPEVLLRMLMRRYRGSDIAIRLAKECPVIS
jgi:glycosyltransferase involved in cell wall biosynthesis